MPHRCRPIISATDMASTVLRERRPDELYQAAGGEGLVDELANSQASSALPRAGIEPGGNQYCRHLDALLLQMVDNVEAAHSGHVLVGHQATRRAVSRIGQEFVSRT